jgi:cell wall-associated NlpC family hydrolase
VERASTTSSRSTERSYVANAPVPQTVAGNAVLEIAARYVGVPYVSGGTTPDGFDCSGFTSYVYAQLGITLPRSSADQRNVGVVVSAADALPGDLIWSPGHVGIYAGDGMQIDSPRPGKTIQFRSIWQSNPIFIRVTG